MRKGRSMRNENRNNSAENLKLKALWFDDEIGSITLIPTENALNKEFKLVSVNLLESFLSYINDKSLKVDLLILDIVFDEGEIKDKKLRNKDRLELGFEIMKAIRNGEYGGYWKNVIIICLTAATQPKTVEKINKYVESDDKTCILWKPISPSNMIIKINEYLKKKSTQK
jgi:hypothetical protein